MLFNLTLSDEVPEGEIWFLNTKKLVKEAKMRRKKGFKSAKHEHQFKRFMIKGFLTATKTRIGNLIEDDNLTGSEQIKFGFILDWVNVLLEDWKNTL